MLGIPLPELETHGRNSSRGFWGGCRHSVPRLPVMGAQCWVRRHCCTTPVQHSCPRIHHPSSPSPHYGAAPCDALW